MVFTVLGAVAELERSLIAERVRAGLRSARGEGQEIGPSVSKRWGLSWQITPRALTNALAAGGGEAKRAFEAMMTMKKIDIAAIEAARRG